MNGCYPLRRLSRVGHRLRVSGPTELLHERRKIQDFLHPLPSRPVIDQTPQRRFTYVDFILVFAAGLLTSIIATIAAVAAGAIPLDELTTGIPSRAVFWIILPAQVFGQLLALAWIAQRKATGKLSTDYGLLVKIRDIWYLLVGGALLIGLGLALSPLAQALGIDQSPQDVVQAVAGVSDAASRIVVLLGVVVLSPVIEELWFRGLLLRTLLQKRSVVSAIIIQALVFAAFHLLDAGAIQAAAVVIPELFIVGSILGYLAVRSGNLSRSIFTHAGFNLITTLALFYAPNLPF
ncbi:CAAX amino terminal protease self- immunity [bacterium BMS3Abin02]|nr:CAAX amino terminal protease self- immunity [bacterium BMS3Abin02]GBE21216.1 CAAX amino terminal protease self- immunity [bacterium BMS3Bbin01]